MSRINKIHMLLAYLRELRKTGNTRLLTNGMAHYPDKFYVLITNNDSFKEKIKYAYAIDPTVKDRAIPLHIDRIEGFTARRLPIAIDLDVFMEIIRNIFEANSKIIDENNFLRNELKSLFLKEYSYNQIKN